MAHILVVDDDKDLCALLRTALERDGHQVSTRLSGREVDESACRWADCILLDVMMPGEDGFALCRRIRGLADCPILFLTAKTEEADVLTGLGLGGDDYLTKPFRVYWKDTSLKLTKGEYAICEYLAMHPGQTFSKEQLYEAAFGYDGEADASAVTEHIKNIRAKLRPAGESPIETVWGVGYKWKNG